MGIQDFGASFNLETFYRARDVARDLAYELSSMIHPGMTEEEAHQLYKGLCLKHGVEKNWHPPKLRFGPNTLKLFKEASDLYTLKEEDIFFIDIGPVINGHETDYGETFVLGNEYEMKKLAGAAETLFQEVSLHWKENKISGPELYEFAQERATFLGYRLNLGSDGHRIGDFPHHVHFKGGIPECPEVLHPNAWILEIQIASPDNKYGAFYEDILR